MAAAGHWCNHAAGFVASSLKAVAPEQTAMCWHPAVWSGTELSWLHGTGGLEQCWPLTGPTYLMVSILDVACQPAHVLGTPSRARCLTSLQFPSGSAVPWEEPLLKLLAALMGKHGESCGWVASMWSQWWLCFCKCSCQHGRQPASRLYYVGYCAASVEGLLLLPAENIRSGLTTESPIRMLEMPGPTWHSANCWWGGLQALPVELLTAGRVGAVLPRWNIGAVWYIHGFISCHMNVSADHDVHIFRFFFVFILSLKYSKSVGRGHSDEVNRSCRFFGLMSWFWWAEQRNGRWGWETNVFTFCSSAFSKLLSFFKHSNSCKCWLYKKHLYLLLSSLD